MTTEKILPVGFVPKDNRKKILLLSDDMRMPSGVGTMSREIVLGTCHRFNWVQLAAAINHPEAGKVLDASESLTNDIGFETSLKIYPYNGYGDPNVIRQLMNIEKPDMIIHFTDPRYWMWLYQMEHEIREFIPLGFYHVWDSTPYPKYNENYYRSCDWISCISRQTYNIVRQVWKKEPPKNWQVQYIPHGINENQFYKQTSEEGIKAAQELRKKMVQNQEVDFIVLYNNRNIRRKMTGDVVLAFKEFWKSLPREKADKTRLLLHTQAVDENGTDLYSILRDLAPEVKAIFSQDRIDPSILNNMYNISDVVINIASNEGFGLGTAEALMAEKMIIVNVTGGLQDQCGFVNEEGKYLHEDREFNEEWGSNHDGKYQNCGEWAIPVFPNNLGLNGSPATPYIFDPRCTWQDAALAIRKVYDMSPEERTRRGKLGREYMLSEGFSSKQMGQKFINGIETTLVNWTPKKRFGLYKGN